MSYQRQSILFISGLEKTVNENMLYQLFNDYSISYIKIAKDHQTRESFGYAFVGFKNHSKAEEAIAKLNYTKLSRKTIRISWYNREANNCRNRPEFNIFVKRIPKGVTAKDFHERFAKYGTIVSAKLVEDDDGEALGYGFVLYDSEEGAKKAIAECNGKEWDGKVLYVGQFEKNRPKKPVQFNNIYVKNIPKEWSEDDIKKYFAKYGTISSMITREPEEGRLNPELPVEKKEQILKHKYAFVCFEKLDGPAVHAVNEVPYYKLNNKAYNDTIDKLVDVLKKEGIEEDKRNKCACYIEENKLTEKVLNDEKELKDAITAFNKLLSENDGIFFIKDKTDRLECCQALKKAERAKRLRQLYEKIKKKIKEKYKFCNLYVKNLPDSYEDADLKKLFQEFGEIRSCKVVKKELRTNYLALKTSIKVFGFVCFFEPEKAQAAKSKLNQKSIQNGTPKLYVDYHQTKQERTEFLKLKLIKNSEKVQNPRLIGARPMPGQFPPMMRSFPPQHGFPPMPRAPMMMMPNQMQMQRPPMDKNQKNDYYGEQLYAKISSMQQFKSYFEYFPKIVGIFLDLNDEVLDRLLVDNAYFSQQVNETIKLLTQNK